MDMIAPAIGWKAPRYELAEAKLWRAAFSAFVCDAMRYHQGLPARYGQHVESEAAYHDLMECGAHLRHLCDMVDMDAEVCSERFRRWCARNPKN